MLKLKIVLLIAFLAICFCAEMNAQRIHMLNFVDDASGSGSVNDTSGSGSASDSGSASESASGSASGSSNDTGSGSVSGSGSGSSNDTGSGSYDGDNACISIKDCSTCVSNHSCVFCKDRNTTATVGFIPYCVPGGWSGPTSQTIPCPGWTWHQCSLTGHWIIVLIGIGAGAVLVVVLGCCTWCWCRYRRRGGKYKSHHDAAQDIEEIESQKRLLSGTTRTPMTDTHREIMKEKWGTK